MSTRYGTESDPGYSSEATNAPTRFTEEKNFSAGPISEMMPEPISSTPQELGEYILLEQIGVGGMGKVYRAEHKTMKRHVALKILNSRFAARQVSLDQFFGEVRTLAQLMHPNIVTAFDAGRIGNTHFLVMELVDGELLSTYVQRSGPLATGMAVSMLEQAGKALEYAHSRGVIHRDIKPNNMMITKDGVLKILDFGLARFGQKEAFESDKAIVMGTAHFMSPEQIEAPESVDGRSDLYGLGATLFHLLTGRTMFTGDRNTVTQAQLTQKAPHLFTLRSDVDLRIDAIYQRLVKKVPAERYQSASEMLAALRTLNLSASTTTETPQINLGIRLSDLPTSAAITQSTFVRKVPYLAIDIGFETSCAAFYDPVLGPKQIKLTEDGSPFYNCLKSTKDSIQFGLDAKSDRFSSPHQFAEHFQRWIGHPTAKLPLFETKVRAEVAIAALIRNITLSASRKLDQVTSAVVTVPASYGQLHRRSIRDACRIAGLEPMQLLDKPLAAALSWMHGLNESNGAEAIQPKQIHSSLALVVVLTGTGLDASVIHIEPDVVRQLSTHGNWKLGTWRWKTNWEAALIASIEKDLGQSLRDDASSIARLHRTASLAYEQLKKSAKVEVKFDWRGKTARKLFTQADLLRHGIAYVEAIESSIAKACSAGKINPAEIDHLIMVGSMMSLPKLLQSAKKLLPAHVSVHHLPKSAIALGAAIQAHALNPLFKAPVGAVKRRAISCTSTDIALLSEAVDLASVPPRLLVEKCVELPTSTTRSLRAPVEDVLDARFIAQLIERSTTNAKGWHPIYKLDAERSFPQRKSNTPLQLKIELDESGLASPLLIWPDGNRQTVLDQADPVGLTDSEVEHWKNWLETNMLCSTL